MKKIISRHYFFVAFLLVIADQKCSGLVLRSDLATGLSDFAYYLSDMLLNFLVV
ncbi:metal-dependent CAAX amino terminal membrane protease, partial [Salmonella enterica subsp. enterica serovar Typhi]|nr:metal-dependent CAAX amino terminal membrane protease [Salmonella enterica subsp. enterica serovar Typhi]